MQVAEQSLLEQKSLWAHARETWVWLVTGCIVSFELASIVLVGWPLGLIPRIRLPFVYGGDGLAILWLIRRAMEGWVFNNPRSGFPFGSSFLDYPGSDVANFALFKLLGLLTSSPFVAINLFMLLSFPAVFAVSMVVFRSFGLRNSWGFVGSMLLAFAPFHFARFFYGHDLYLWYMCVPLFIHYGKNIFLYGQSHADLRRPHNLLSAALGIVTVSCFGVYYAFFGLIVVCVSGVAGAMRAKTWKPLLSTILLCAAVTASFGANIAPNVFYWRHEGKNLEVAARSPIETEVYSLKIIHLLLPQPDHRIDSLGAFSRRYDVAFPLSNTNSSLGIVGVAGFFALLLCAVAALSGVIVAPSLTFAAIVTLTIVLVSAVGGLNVVFALLVSPLIRGWDRASIFINCTAILGAMLLLQRITVARNRMTAIVVGTMILAIGLLDETPTSYAALVQIGRNKADADRSFVRQIETLMPAESSIYVLPYMPFPESAPVNGIESYDLTTGFTNSERLRWSFGGMAGRKGDLFYRALAKRSIGEQLDVVRHMGFSGVYVDRRGFTDRGVKIEAELSQALGHGPALVRPDGVVSFFDIRK